MKRSSGFTLIELAIVMVLITILISGLAVPLTAQIQARRIAETRTDMRAIHDALIGYAMSHTFAHPSGVTRHFLPCPDDGSVSPGVEAMRNPVSGRCPSTRGTLPWRTLGVKGQDAWGNRYTYAVTMEFANDTSGFVSTPIPSQGDRDIFPDAGCALPTVAENVPAVVVSHGPNGRGAQNVGGGTPLAAADLPVDERHNLIAPSAIAPCNESSFVSRTPTETFDDLLIWVSPNELFSRVCPASGCL